jgi:ergothioneine biosynthesis protein EgtB
MLAAIEPPGDAMDPGDAAGLSEDIDRHGLLTDFWRVRAATEQLCAPLGVEDYVVQAMADASPAKWHIAHVTWFFETFLLKPFLDDYAPTHPAYEYLFNSYYNGAGPQFSRPNRGLLTRPTVAEIYEYRRHVEEGVEALVEAADPAQLQNLAPILTLGLHHEQQHQELLLTDLKYNLWCNPLRPAYHDTLIPRGSPVDPLRWRSFDGGMAAIGHRGDGFAFDNEGPCHEVLLQPYRVASRPVTCAEFLQWMEDIGYGRHDLWLSEGWSTVREQGWDSPLYWERRDGQWQIFTLSGMQSVDPAAPVCHVSYFEADAYARWAEKRLPTEHEWEHGAQEEPVEGHFVDEGICEPVAAGLTRGPTGPEGDPPRLDQLYGDVWQWTQSAYLPYPGFRPMPGALGEYNGKFMVNQMVLRGGSCATPRGHVRPSYRNVFRPADRWQFMGIRLAE